MAGEPSIVKITDALATLFGGMDDVQVFPDRSDAEPIGESERPAVAFRFTRVQFLPTGGQSEIRHAATLDIDFYEVEPTEARISTKLSRMIAEGNALIAADRTVGGRVESFELSEASAELDFVPDYGCATLTCELTWLTPRDDFTTILGASGIF